MKRGKIMAYSKPAPGRSANKNYASAPAALMVLLQASNRAPPKIKAKQQSAALILFRAACLTPNLLFLK